MKVSIFQGIIFAVCILGAIIGVFVFATYTSKNSSTEIGPVFMWGTLSGEDMEMALTEMKQTEESLKNVSYIQKDPKTLAVELSSAIATGAAPDLVLASQEELHALSKFLSPISLDALPIRTFQSTFVQQGNMLLVQGGTGYYGIPFLVDPLVLFSNRPILASSGVARPPATWESLIGLVPKVAQFTSTRQVTRGLIAFGTYDNVHNARAILSSLLLQTDIPISSYAPGGGFLANLGGASGDSSASPGRAVLGFYTQFADPSKVSYTWNASLPDSERMFLTGDLALYPGYVSRARYLRLANPNLNFIVSPLPQPATAKLKSVYGLLYSLMIPRGARNASGAYQTAILLSSPLEQATAASHTGLAPAVLSQLSARPSDPIAAVAYTEALYSKGWLSPSAESVDRVFSDMIGNVISGRSSLTNALVSAEQALSALLKK